MNYKTFLLSETILIAPKCIMNIYLVNVKNELATLNTIVAMRIIYFFLNNNFSRLVKLVLRLNSKMIESQTMHESKFSPSIHFSKNKYNILWTYLSLRHKIQIIMILHSTGSKVSPPNQFSKDFK